MGSETQDLIVTSHNPVKNWFGHKFSDLHPLLQRLHDEGGSLAGPIEVELQSAIAGWIGRRLARKLGAPHTGGAHALAVTIFHDGSSLHWNRRFDHQCEMLSVFTPVGSFPNGYWEEATGVVTLRLTVDVKEGGWHWRVLGARIGGVTIPLWLLPRIKAFKTVEDCQYRFYVGVSLPVLGTVLSYSGLLLPAIVSEPCGNKGT